MEAQAINYEDGSAYQKEAGMRLIKELNVCRGSVVLDLGCGTGYLTKMLSEEVGSEGKVVAVDPDGERLKIAREKYSASNIEYIQADDQTFPSGQYDLVFSNIVIHWISDKEALFKRVYDNLRPGGRFAFTTPNGAGAQVPPEIGKKLFDELLGPSFLHDVRHNATKCLCEDEYKILVESTGFTHYTTAVWDYYPEWKNLDKYISSMHGWFQGRFDPTQFNSEVLQRIKKEYGSGKVTQTDPNLLLKMVVTKP